jgi:hypothetical protein
MTNPAAEPVEWRLVDVATPFTAVFFRARLGRDFGGVGAAALAERARERVA